MKQFAMSAAAVLLLAACGGGSGGGETALSPPPVPDQTATVPASASASSVGLVQYLQQLPTADADAREPMALDTFAPPAPDDTEPQALSS